MKLVYKKLSLTIGMSAIGMFQAIAQNDHPNIVFILADDLGYGDVQCLNPRGKIPTPYIDRLAREGVVFTDAHSSSAVCTPTRYGILTGRYNWRSTLKQGVLGLYSKPLIPPGRTTIPEMLKRKGYRTGCIGKWHLGMNFPTTDGNAPVDNGTDYNLDFTKPITGGPSDVGFDYYFGVDAPDYPPFCFIENRNTVGIPDTFYTLDHQIGRRAGRGLRNWDREQILPTLAGKAVEFIRQSAGNQPFFLYLPLTSPHMPIVPIREFQGKSNLNKYADFVMQTDAVVGSIEKALHDRGIAENTMIVFASDNGCSPVADFAFLEGKGHDPSYIFRGTKADLFEGGHHIPCIVTWPARWQHHMVDQTICLTDFMATFAGLTGVRLADNEGEDSYNILPLLARPDYPGIIREATVHHSFSGEFSLRKGDWKLLVSPGSGGWSYPSPDKDAAIMRELPAVQLYDLKSDPGEENNVQAEHPEIVHELKALLTKYILEGRSTPGTIQKNDVYPWKQLNWMDHD